MLARLLVSSLPFSISPSQRYDCVSSRVHRVAAVRDAAGEHAALVCSPGAGHREQGARWIKKRKRERERERERERDSNPPRTIQTHKGLSLSPFPLFSSCLPPPWPSRRRPTPPRYVPLQDAVQKGVQWRRKAREMAARDVVGGCNCDNVCNVHFLVLFFFTCTRMHVCAHVTTGVAEFECVHTHTQAHTPTHTHTHTSAHTHTKAHSVIIHHTPPQKTHTSTTTIHTRTHKKNTPDGCRSRHRPGIQTYSCSLTQTYSNPCPSSTHAPSPTCRSPPRRSCGGGPRRG